MVALCSEERLIQSHKAGGYCLHPFTQRRSSGFKNWLDAIALGLIFLASLFPDAGVKGVFGAAVRPEQPAMRGAET